MKKTKLEEKVLELETKIKTLEGLVFGLSQQQHTPCINRCSVCGLIPGYTCPGYHFTGLTY